MQKTPVALRLDEGTYKRVANLARKDRRSISAILMLALEKGLPAIEKHIQSHDLPLDPGVEPGGPYSGQEQKVAVL